MIISTWNNQVKLVRFRGHPQQISVMLNIFWSLRGWRFGEYVKKEKFGAKIFYQMMLNEVLKGCKK